MCVNIAITPSPSSLPVFSQTLTVTLSLCCPFTPSPSHSRYCSLTPSPSPSHSLPVLVPHNFIFLCCSLTPSPSPSLLPCVAHSHPHRHTPCVAPSHPHHHTPSCVRYMYQHRECDGDGEGVREQHREGV